MIDIFLEWKISQLSEINAILTLNIFNSFTFSALIIRVLVYLL